MYLYIYIQIYRYVPREPNPLDVIFLKYYMFILNPQVSWWNAPIVKFALRDLSILPRGVDLKAPAELRQFKVGGATPAAHCLSPQLALRGDVYLSFCVSVFVWFCRYVFQSIHAFIYLFLSPPMRSGHSTVTQRSCCTSCNVCIRGYKDIPPVQAIADTRTGYINWMQCFCHICLSTINPHATVLIRIGTSCCLHPYSGHYLGLHCSYHKWGSYHMKYPNRLSPVGSTWVSLYKLWPYMSGMHIRIVQLWGPSLLLRR